MLKLIIFPRLNQGVISTPEDAKEKPRNRHGYEVFIWR